jgi:hypothetical protein
MKFTQWLLIKEAKGTIPTTPEKNDDMLIQGKVGKIGTGHQPHMSGAGKHDSRPNRERTRQGQNLSWQRNQKEG